LIRCIALLLCVAPGIAAARSTLPLEFVADIALPGPAARFDYVSFDVSRNLLYIAHMGAGRVLEVNVITSQVRVVADMPDVHGVLAVPALNRVYATVTARNEVAVIDADTLDVVATVPTGRYPDAIAWVPQSQKLFVSDKLGHSDTVIDVRARRAVATIALGGEVGNTHYDPLSKHVFANVQGTRELVEIDPDSHRIVARYPLEGARGNHGLYIEPVQHVAFIACEGNDRLITFDLDTKRQSAIDATGAGPDVLAFDPGLRLLYVAAESGVVSMFRQQGKKLVKIGEDRLAPAAHSVAVNAHTHDVYFPLKNVGGRPLLRVMRPVADLR
jgi:YVTN family beta-propeller protein